MVGWAALCAVCGSLYVPKSLRARYCSDGCRRTAIAVKDRVAHAEGRRAAPRRTDATRENEHRKRARKVGAAVGERVVRAEVGDRDGWVCFCGEAVDRELLWPDGRSASVDHVVPLSLGGAHCLSNVRISHLDCNVRRGAARGERLADLRGVARLPLVEREREAG